MAQRIDTTIDILAPPERVWDVLTDFVSYPRWNPFVTRLDGFAKAGERLEVRIEPPGGRAMTFRPVVLRAEPSRHLAWKGRLFLPGLFDGEHSFRIEVIQGGSRFHQSEHFTGVLVPLFGGMLKQTERGFEAMNEALRRRCEGRQTEGS